MLEKKSPAVIKLMALAQLVDSPILAGSVWIKALLKGLTPARKVALALHSGRIVGFFWVIVSPSYLERLAREKIETILGGKFST